MTTRPATDTRPNSPTTFAGRALTALMMAVFVAAGTTGCVERRLAFRSTVEDVEVAVELDGEPIGTTPTEVGFIRYGTREWTARADGYETAQGRARLRVPWYQYPPFDFFAEVLWPGTIHDRHYVFIEPKPLREREIDPTYERARDWRERARRDLELARERDRATRR